MFKKEEYKYILERGRKAPCPYRAWQGYTRAQKDKIEKNMKKRIAARLKKSGKKQGLKMIPAIGYVTAAGFALNDYFVEDKSFTETIITNTPYVGAVYEANQIYSELNNIDSILEQDIMRNAEKIDLSEYD